MIRVKLTPAQRDELRIRTRAVGIAPHTRDRLEMVRLADAGWSVPAIAAISAATSRRCESTSSASSPTDVGSLPDRPRSGRPPVVTAAHLVALEELPDAWDRTWTPRSWWPGWLRLKAHRHLGGAQAARRGGVRREGPVRPA